MANSNIGDGNTTANLEEKMRGLMDINPLIDSDGDTTRVRSVLTAISTLVDKSSNNGACTLDADATFGVMVMLQSCCAALKQMTPIHAP